MHHFVTRYGTAAHLALLTAAPLFLFPVFGPAAASVVLLWLSLFALVWAFAAPAPRGREQPHEARERVARRTVRDPLFWLSLAAVVWTGLRALNSGAGLVYDAEVRAWKLCAGAWDWLPASADGTGLPVFACAVACAVAFLVTRHSLDAEGRVSYALALSVFTALAAAAGWFAISYGWAPALAMARCAWTSPSFVGVFFTISMLTAEIAVFGCAELAWHKAEPVAFIALVGCTLGAVAFSPPALVALSVALLLVLMAWSALTTRARMPATDVFRCSIATLVAVAAAAAAMLFSGTGSVLAARIAELQKMAFVPDNFMTIRAAVSDVALKAWRGAVWFGTGIGTFADDLRRFSPEEMWTVVDPRQSGALNGWWQLLAERGAAGLLVLVLPVLALVWTYVAHAIRLGAHFSCLRPIHALAPLVLVLAGVVTTFGISFTQVGVLLASATVLSLSASAMSPSESAGPRD